MAMVLLLVVLMAIYAIWFGLQRTYSYTDDDMQAQAEARTALNEMVEYIRTARLPENPPSDSLAMVIVSADDNSLVCWTDTDRDPNHDSRTRPLPRRYRHPDALSRRQRHRGCDASRRPTRCAW